jgi:hypothetical protein
LGFRLTTPPHTGAEGPIVPRNGLSQIPAPRDLVPQRNAVLVALRVSPLSPVVHVRFTVRRLAPCSNPKFHEFGLLHIYVGSFLQIFTFARYFREHLIPTINRLGGRADAKLFHWEDWARATSFTQAAPHQQYFEIGKKPHNRRWDGD